MANSYHPISHQPWSQSTFQPNHDQTNLQLEQYEFSDSLADTQVQSQGQAQRAAQLFPSASYPYLYSPNQSQRPSQQPLQTQFIGGHVDPATIISSGSSSSTTRDNAFASAQQQQSASLAVNYNINTATLDPSGFANSASYNYDSTLTSQPFAPPSQPMQSSYTLNSGLPTYPASQTQQPYYQSPNAKRSRIPDEDQDNKGYLSEEVHEQTKDSAAGKAKLPGACSRCKNLKVKCELKTDTDPCKRCLNGGHECITPGRKKRRTPPKREHLLNQIREQAAQIQRLMSQLEEVNRKPPNLQHISPSGSTHNHRPWRSPNNSGLHSPVLSPSPTQEYFSDAHSTHRGNSISPSIDASKDVLDWITKARESIEAFGGYIQLGGTGMPKSLLVNEDSDSSDEPEDDEYEIEVEEYPEVDCEVDAVQGRRRKPSSTSSVGESGVRNLSIGPRKRDSGDAFADKMAILPGEATPYGLMAKLALKKRSISGRSGDERDEDDGEEEETSIAHGDFFTPRPTDSVQNRDVNSPLQTPHILTRNIITPEEAEKLFAIYFNYMNMSVSLLDPVLYTAPKTCWRSPFLFTVICAIASRYYSPRPELYNQLMHSAQLAAGTELISGRKSVESCQGYILLSLYPVPARRWEEDRCWLYLGLAIRVAIDLNLHLPNTVKPINEQHAREMLNRTRVWLNCFNLDRSTGSQYGKTSIIRNTDYVACHSEGWWESSEYNMENFDIHLCVYNAELRATSAVLQRIYSDPNHPTGLNKEVDFEQIATEADEVLVKLGDKWFAKLATTDMSNTQNCFRTGLLRLAYSYGRLVVLSFGFQHAFGKGNTDDENPFLQRCLRAASDVVNAVVDDIGRPSQRIYLRHGPQAQSVFVTFACSFLVKLLQPKFASYLTTEKRLEIRGLVKKVVDLLGSPEVAIDNRHGPKLYSRFLKGLLATPMAKVETDGTPAVPRRTRRPKSATPDCEAPFEFSGTVSNHPSPATSHSISPPPSTLAIPFDQFAPVTGGIDPLVPISAQTGAFVVPVTESDDIPGMNMSFNDFFQPPLPFDTETLQYMQSLANPMWSDTSLPGFNWMSQFQSNSDILMSND